MTAFTTDGESGNDSGEFRRQDAQFRETPECEPGRYHLYVARACPWCHRTMIARERKGLVGSVGISYCDPFRDERGWAFAGAGFVDDVNGWDFMAQAYPDDFAGRVTVPVLWDKRDGRIVNNESSDIIRLFDAWGDGPVMYPDGHSDEIDAVNEQVYDAVNNGVYRAGFARRQEAYEGAYRTLFATLAELDERLATRRYLVGDEITEADWRLFVTLVRFDSVYHTHFRVNGRLIAEYEHLWPYTRDLYQQPGVAETVAMDEIKRHYYTTHDELNPKRIIPLGGPTPEDFLAPHGRDGL